MNISRVIDLLSIEKECIMRQDTKSCCRYTDGCENCDLVQESDDLIQAYDIAIKICKGEIYV